MPHATIKSFPRGVYAPLNTFFLPDSQDLDIPTFKKHAVNIASAGVGLVALGSMGEAVHLDHAERNTIVKAAREALDENNLSSVPLIIGTAASSTRETIELTREAAEAGADYAMVISPGQCLSRVQSPLLSDADKGRLSLCCTCSGYFVGALSKDALKTYFAEVAAASPIPIIIYNYPGSSAGIDLDTDTIIAMAKDSPNIVGIKLTCGSVGKLTRLVNLRPDFLVLGGFVDFLAPAMLLNGAGCITGLGNVAPKSCMKLFNLTQSGLNGSAKDLAAAKELQVIVSNGDWTMCKVGIAGSKYVLSKLHGYGGEPRRPILPFSGDGEKLLADLKPLLDYENSLP
ncbi:BZ3500_MvSof-1268-A1-R1_Chr3-1g05544 [Microbotryum saponariae]|uniref:BZ3500_MvSof-1268-A1-R1_Chr3-1g05544 protein n=1 Tax=Microbotryum saponariae TaxID=289078 RepID=A0A2X0M686_9BASI|nr:BZ3500_MvSof-1268-A1-R1_Chr3-1g05544 [Microbotryum saponariae]SDA04735.1 BZ3501_MvSof-1269-A2-R1_Chr3-1g05215 [Microbotryum saponariae]